MTELHFINFKDNEYRAFLFFTNENYPASKHMKKIILKLQRTIIKIFNNSEFIYNLILIFRRKLIYAQLNKRIRKELGILKITCLNI